MADKFIISYTTLHNPTRNNKDCLTLDTRSQWPGDNVQHGITVDKTIGGDRLKICLTQGTVNKNTKI